MNTACLVVLLPLISFFILFFFRYFLSYRFVVIISIISSFISTLLVFFLGRICILNHYFIYYKTLWTWWFLENCRINITFLVDNLSYLFIMMITFVTLLVYVFSSWYMKKDNYYAHFFAFMNLFVANMLILVLSDNFLFMYLGWEGVSFCSYLLINFYYYKTFVNLSSMKSFLITKIGDLFFILAILMIYTHYHTFGFYEIRFLIKVHLIQYQKFLNVITLLLLLGAVGKSAQIPLQVWLPKAMVGPAPVSALIHAATMVTAGVYLILRNYDIFILTPDILMIVGIIGCLTLFLSSCSALVQKDIKYILAYSTMSQIGYMFLALGIGAWNCALIHLLTHAFFKALLFLSIGSLIFKCQKEQNIFLMGNKLYRQFPFLYIFCLIGGCSLSAFPIITSGFYSKGEILLYAYNSHHILFFIIAMISSFLTSVYISRLLIVTFHSTSRIVRKNVSISKLEYVPLIIFSIFSTYVGFYIIPDISCMFKNIPVTHHLNKIYLEFFSSFMVFSGFFVSYYLYIINRFFLLNFLKYKFMRYFYIILTRGFGFFDFYHVFFIKPYFCFINFLSNKPFKYSIDFSVLVLKKLNYIFLYTENRILSLYIMMIIIYTIFLTCMIILY
ncbi:NADH-quinone oxidoreductase subunit L [Buchnera aphidicola]|uniref:NADH-quinone oxidoreductase subunit L n=1 Tax=Buchnera aphidicola TaxID=9 RepID=UPI0034643C90